jgi:hypothetical protein
MIDLDINRLFEDDDFPALGISVRFGAVERYLKLLLEFVPHVQDQTLVRFKAEMDREASRFSANDFVDEVAHLKSEIENLIPASFYGSFVVVLYAALESAISDVADYVKKKEVAQLSLSDLREANSLKRLSLYLETLMKQPLNTPAGVMNFLQQLQLVRNVIAHANGSLRDQRQDRRTALQRLAEENIGVLIENNSLVVTTAFLQRSLSSAADFVNALLAQVIARYPVK